MRLSLLYAKYIHITHILHPSFSNKNTPFSSRFHFYLFMFIFQNANIWCTNNMNSRVVLFLNFIEISFQTRISTLWLFWFQIWSQNMKILTSSHCAFVFYDDFDIKLILSKFRLETIAHKVWIITTKVDCRYKYVVICNILIQYLSNLVKWKNVILFVGRRAAQMGQRNHV